MKNKLTYIFGCLMTFSLLHASEKNPFDDLFKNFDFDKFLSDMEKEIEKDEKESPAPTKSTATTSTTTTSTATTAQETTDQSFGKTKEELFLHPTMQPSKDKEKTAKTALTKKSRQAFNDVIRELVSLVNELESKAMGMHQFSTPFKESLSKYLDAFDKINVAGERILSKKLYSTMLPFEQTKAPAKDEKEQPKKEPPSKHPKDAAQSLALRQDILNTIQALKKLIAKIKYDPAKEESESDEERLRELQKRPHDIIDFSDEPLMKSKKKRWHQTEEALPHDEPNINPEKITEPAAADKPQDTARSAQQEEVL